MKPYQMQPRSKNRPGLVFLVLGLALLAPAGTTRAADLLVNTFDADISGIGWQNWRAYVTGHTLAWDAAQDADGNAGSGAMDVTINWPQTGWVTSWNDVQVAFSTTPFTPADYLTVEAYVRIDVTNSSKTVNANSYGVCGLYLNGGTNTWKQIQGYRVLSVTNGWQKVSGSLAGVVGTGYNQVVVGFISNGGESPTNTIRYWVDNVRLIGPPSVYTNRPTLSLAKAPPAGLTCMASAPGDAWQRQMVRTVNSTYSWHTANAASNITTYSINVAAFPGAAQSGFEAMMYLVPVTGMSSPDDPSVDWDSANVVYFTISGNANGTGKGNFRYKVNSDHAETFQSWTDHNCATGPLGTWSLTFNNNTNVTITAPNGTTTDFAISDTDVANFQGDLIAYFGVRPTDTSRIGLSATFGRIKITGATGTIDDNFSAGPPYVLDAATWVKKASSPQGIFITAPDAKYWVSWPQPDGGYTNLFATDNLNKKLVLGQWSSLPVSDTGWLNVAGNSRIAVVNQSTLSAAFSHSPTNSFFGLFHP